MTRLESVILSKAVRVGRQQETTISSEIAELVADFPNRLVHCKPTLTQGYPIIIPFENVLFMVPAEAQAKSTKLKPQPAA